VLAELSYSATIRFSLIITGLAFVRLFTEWRINRWTACGSTENKLRQIRYTFTSQRQWIFKLLVSVYLHRLSGYWTIVNSMQQKRSVALEVVRKPSVAFITPLHARFYLITAITPFRLVCGITPVYLISVEKP